MSFFQIPLKPVSSLSLYGPLQKYLVSQYGKTTADSYNEVLSRIQQQRDELLNAQERSKGSRDVCLSYAGYLEHLNQHFPINAGQKRIKLTFTWADVFQRKRASQGNLFYEMACVLFNAAVLESQIAISESRLTADSIVNAVKYFQSSAGLFNFIRETICPKIVEKITPDISAEALELFETLMIAQAQQCVVEKSILGKMKKDSVAKLTIDTANLYDSVYSRMQSSALSGMFDKSWQGYAQGKALYYRALAIFYMSQHHNEKDEKGLELCSLYKARQLIDLALNCKLGSELKQLAKDLLDEIKSATSKGHHENDKVYHDRIPPVEDLAPIEGKRIAKAKIPASLQELANVPDVFHELFPIPVMEAQQKFKEDVNAKFATAFKVAREHRDVLKLKLAEKGLPGSIMADEKEPKFPDQVHTALDRIKEQGGLNRLRSLRLTVQEMANETRNQCSRLQQELHNEDKEDREARNRFQNSWPRLTSNQLTTNFFRELEKCIIKVEQASKSDEHIDAKISQNESIFEKMVQSREEVDRLMPRADLSSQTQASAAKLELKQLLTQLDELFGKESDIERTLHQEKEVAGEAICADLIKNQPNIDIVIRQYLQKFDDRLEEFADLAQSEDQLFSKIINSHMKYSDGRSESKNQHERQEAVQKMFDAVRMYDEIAANLGEGIGFYTAMQDYIAKLGQRIEDYVFSRRTEMKDMIENIQQAQMSMSSYYQSAPNMFQQQRQAPPPQGQAPPQGQFRPQQGQPQQPQQGQPQQSQGLQRPPPLQQPPPFGNQYQMPPQWNQYR